MIRFIYGESGYGKTYAITEMLRADAEKGIHSFFIVPEQQAVGSERMLLTALPPSAQLTLEVLNFSRLYNRVCREYGGLEYNYITTPAKYLLMNQMLCELSPMLEHYGAESAQDSSLTEFMLSSVGELKANGITSAQLEAAADKLDKSSKLYTKLRDLSLIYAAYCSAVSQSFSDSADDVSKLSELLKKHNFFRGANVYIDSFTSFTAAEHAVIERIFAQAENVTVSISLPRDRYESIYTASISASERRLIKNAENHGGYDPIILTENKRAKFPSLAHLSDNLWSLGKTVPAELDDGAVSLEVCENPYAEAEAAARWTLELMRSGMRCHDIVVIMRDAEKYRGIIEPAFERNKIPFFFSEKSDLCSKSAVKFILSALRIKNHGWRTADVISHLKTGIYDLPEASIDMFESYVNTWNIKGNRFTDDYWTMNPDGYAEIMTERGSRILAAANEVRKTLCDRLIPLFAKLDAAQNVRESCVAIYEYLSACDVESALSRLAARSASLGNIKEAEEYASLYKIILDALALVAELFTDTEMNTEELTCALKLVFDKTDIGTIPTSIDEVTIGSASLIRADNPKCAIILGLCEGDFPQSVTDSGMLNTPEREILAELGVELSSNSDMKSSDELMFAKRAFSLPSEKLILITARASTDGRAKQPSLPYERTKKLLPLAVEHIFDESDITYLTCSAESAARYVFSQRSETEAETLRSALISRGEDYAYLETYAPSPISVGDCSVSEETAKAVFPKRMRLSQSRLEKYVKCNFSYYCSYVLGLREEKSASFRASDIGTFVHFILENLLRTAASNGFESICDNDKLTALVDTAVKDYITHVCPAYERSTGRFVHLYTRLRNLSLLLAKNIVEEFSHSDFEPKYFEMKLDGREGSPAPLEFVMNNGDRISLSGVVDRVDLMSRDGKVYVRVVDYKTGTKDFSLDDLSLGLNTQMLIYLFTLCASKAKTLLPDDATVGDEPPVPTGVVYLSSNIPTIELEDYADEADVLSRAEKAFDRSGLLLDDEDILKAMNDSLSPDFLAGVKQDKKGALTGKALTSAEKFLELRAEIEQTIISIAAEMKSGKADAKPMIHNGSSPCEWCEMKPVCKRIDSTVQLVGKENENGKSMDSGAEYGD